MKMKNTLKLSVVAALAAMSMSANAAEITIGAGNLHTAAGSKSLPVIALASDVMDYKGIELGLRGELTPTDNLQTGIKIGAISAVVTADYPLSGNVFAGARLGLSNVVIAGPVVVSNQGTIYAVQDPGTRIASGLGIGYRADNGFVIRAEALNHGGGNTQATINAGYRF